MYTYAPAPIYISPFSTRYSHALTCILYAPTARKYFSAKSPCISTDLQWSQPHAGCERSSDSRGQAK